MIKLKDLIQLKEVSTLDLINSIPPDAKPVTLSPEEKTLYNAKSTIDDIFDEQSMENILNKIWEYELHEKEKLEALLSVSPNLPEEYQIKLKMIEQWVNDEIQRIKKREAIKTQYIQSTIKALKEKGFYWDNTAKEYYLTDKYGRYDLCVSTGYIHRRGTWMGYKLYSYHTDYGWKLRGQFQFQNYKKLLAKIDDIRL